MSAQQIKDETQGSGINVSIDPNPPAVAEIDLDHPCRAPRSLSFTTGGFSAWIITGSSEETSVTPPSRAWRA